MMTVNMLVWTTIFISISKRCSVIDALTDVMPVGGVGMRSAALLVVRVLSGMVIVPMTTPAITLEFVVEVIYAVDVLANLLLTAMILILPAIVKPVETGVGICMILTALPVYFCLVKW